MATPYNFFKPDDEHKWEEQTALTEQEPWQEQGEKQEQEKEQEQEKHKKQVRCKKPDCIIPPGPITAVRESTGGRAEAIIEVSRSRGSCRSR